jgi:hypothetical protein
VSIKKNNAGKVLLVRIDLEGNPWKDVKYQITMHVITSHGISLRKIIVAADSKGHWHGLVTSDGKTEGNKSVVKVDADKSQLTVELPAENIKTDSASTYLISATSFLQKHILDQSPTEIIKFSF